VLGVGSVEKRLGGPQAIDPKGSSCCGDTPPMLRPFDQVRVSTNGVWRTHLRGEESVRPGQPTEWACRRVPKLQAAVFKLIDGSVLKAMGG